MSGTKRIEVDGVWVAVNAEDMTFAEWDAAARLGEAAKVAAHERARAACPPRRRLRPHVDAAVRLGALLPSYFSLSARMSDRRARAAWCAGEDPADYAAAPRPIPRRSV